ncbi:MAG: GDP-L-fucose synthase [Rikenellaceae bacterium]|nr:GDP-L-fucose synthase [Rikenellaceae bacterium]
MDKSSLIYVAGHTGLVGSAICNALRNKGFNNVVTRTHRELELMDRAAVKEFFDKENPGDVFLAAARVGGIMANNIYRADFIYDNLQIQQNIIGESFAHGVKKLLFLGSTCIYPKNSPQPIKEEYLLSGELEYTNEPYAIAKIAGLKMCESFNLQYGTDYIAVMPTNLYGPNDNFDLDKSHVLPAMIRKIFLARCIKNGDYRTLLKDYNARPYGDMGEVPEVLEIIEKLKDYGIYSSHVELWGSGKPLREFLWSGDMAEACVYIMQYVNSSDLCGDKKEIRNCHINIGTGKEISIHDLALVIARVIGYEGEIKFDNTKPDGTMRKLTDVSKLNGLGWRHTVELDEGIGKLYEWYLDNLK